MTSDRPNAEQIQYWNETAGPKWVAFQAQIDGHIRPLGQRAIERAAPREGERLLDVGCGCGETTLDLGRRVGANGSATGVDISAVMLQRAQQRAEETGLRNVRFLEADAQTHAFPSGGFDALYSRFGVMFFADPPAAFANLRRALRAGGRLTFVCWQAVQKNPWMFVPMAAAMQHIALPLPAGADAPGPFAFADRDRVARILAQAGFADVEIEALEGTLSVAGGGTLDEVVEFLLQMGPTGAALRDAGPDTRPKVAAAVREALLPYQTPAGVQMDAAAWLVSGRNDA
jgi:SAM-dependent methyltransferase